MANGVRLDPDLQEDQGFHGLALLAKLIMPHSSHPYQVP